MAARIIVPARVRTFDAHGEVRAGPDRLAGEEPLEIRLNGQQFTVTMRTPGDDFELVTGLLLSEAVITESRTS